MFTRSTEPATKPALGKISAQPAALALANGPTPVPAPPAVRTSVIGNDLTILGQGITIISKGSLQLDGEIRGNLHGTEILVGDKGKVTGSIAAESVVIRGEVSGTIRGLNVVLEQGARVDGEIHHQSLAISSGASFEGRVRRPQDTAELMPQLDPGQHGSQAAA